MKLRRSPIRILAILAAFLLIAASCGGGSDVAADSDTTDSSDADTGEVVGAIPTTAPITAGEPEEDSVSTVDEGDDDSEDAGAGLPPADPDEVSVLHVNDDVQIVPVFDAPHGEEITLVDVNDVDGTEQDYPLLAETHFNNRLALLVEEYDSTGHWAKVLMPVRPNGTTAWVQTAFFTEEKHNYHITINVTNNMVQVFRGEEQLLEQLAVTGRSERPTPVLRAYVDEKIKGESHGPAYGDWILSIAAFSETLGTFGGGGMPKLALHGTNQPELMGQYVSSGCIRVPNEIVSFIAETVPVGTIVDIVA